MARDNGQLGDIAALTGSRCGPVHRVRGSGGSAPDRLPNLLPAQAPSGHSLPFSRTSMPPFIPPIPLPTAIPRRAARQ
jgi:hypothetical protein